MMNEFDENNEIYEDVAKIYEAKKEQLYAIIDSYVRNDVIVAFTGGVGSSLLLSLFQEISHSRYGKVYAITIRTMYKPAYDIAVARKVAKELSATHSVISLEEECQLDLTENPSDRCYRCKYHIYSKLNELANELEVPTIVEGTNYDDYYSNRPGIQAVREYHIKSPFVEAGFTKENVLRLAKERNISVTDRPASTCLATRFPYGAHLDMNVVKNVEECEAYIKSLGMYDIRVRVHGGDLARIQVKQAEIDRLLKHRNDISTYMKDHGFSYVTLDLQGFQSGSMKQENNQKNDQENNQET